MIYVVFFSCLLILRCFLRMRVHQRQLLYKPLLVLLLLISAFRFEVGCDWSGYLNQFYVYGALSSIDILFINSPLWYNFFIFQNWAGLPYPWINVFSSLIFFYGIHALARRQPDPFSFLILLFPILIINMPMSGIRQAAAIGVMCIAFVAFTDRSIWRFLIFTLLAALFHSSALIFLLLTPIVTGRYSNRRIILSLLLTAPGAFLLLSGAAAEEAMGRYIDSGIVASGAIYRLSILLLTAILFWLSLKQKWLKTFPSDYKLVMIGSLLMAVIFALTMVSSVISDRFGYYLIPIQAVILARIPFLPIPKNRSIFSLVPYLGLLVVFIIYATMSSIFKECYIPYETWLFGLPEGADFSLSNPRYSPLL